MKAKSILSFIVVILVLSSYLLSEMIVYADMYTPLTVGDTGKNISSDSAGDISCGIMFEPTLKIKSDYSYDKSFNIEILSSNTCTNSTLYDYIVSVVMSEMPYTFEKEALKAQAVATRTYTLKLFEDESRHKYASVCTDPSHCSAALNREAYIKKYGEDAYNKAYAAVSAAVDETDGIVIKYDGELCTAVYHSSSYGTTESSYNLWGSYTPYLLSVKTPENISPQCVTVSAKALNAASAYDVSVKYNDTGRCSYIVVNDNEIKSSKLRSMLGLKSSKFDLKKKGNELEFTVYGYGHGIGMSQYGANEMAKSGYDYKEILTHYYTGVEVVNVIP